jgi:hypothetical protein
MKGKWGTGVKLALAALGVIVVSTALKQFISYNRSPGKDALFTIGAALLLGFGARAFGAGGIAASALTAGLTVAGVEFVGGQAAQIGNSLASSFRGMTGQPATMPGAVPKGADSSSYFSYGQPGVPLGVGLMPSQGGIASGLASQMTPAQGFQPQPVSQAPQQVSITYEAAERPSDLAVIAQSALSAAGSFFQGGFSSIVGGSKGIGDMNWRLGSGSLSSMRALVSS